MINKGYADENTSYSDLDDIVIDIANEKEALEKDINDVKETLVENELIAEGTPNDLIPEAIEEGLEDFVKPSGTLLIEENGEYDVIDKAYVNVEVESSGGAEVPIDNGAIYEGKYRIRYFDVDGTVLKIEYVADGGKTTPPDAPSYDSNYLIFDEWNYDIDNYIVEQPTDIGATYKTVDDATYLFCLFNEKTGLNVSLGTTGYTSIDWGDGTIDTNTTHIYSQEGEYVIKINGNSTLKYQLLGTPTALKVLKKIYIAKGITVIPPVFDGAYNLKVVSLPTTATQTENSTFRYCYLLKNIIFPRNFTSIASNSFRQCYSLKNIICSQNLVLQQYSITYCETLKEIIIPKGVTNIDHNAIQSCYTLQNIVLPSTLQSIGDYSFRYLYTISNIIINSIPTLNVNSFYSSDITPLTIFWVKDDIIEQLKTTTNWANFADYMKPLSWYPSLTEPNA